MNVINIHFYVYDFDASFLCSFRYGYQAKVFNVLLLEHLISVLRAPFEMPGIPTYRMCMSILLVNVHGCLLWRAPLYQFFIHKEVLEKSYARHRLRLRPKGRSQAYELIRILEAR